MDIFYCHFFFLHLIIFISSQKYYYYRRPIGNWHAWLETHRRPQHASSETGMPDRRPWHASLETPTCLFGDPLETNIPDWRTSGDPHAWSETHWRPQHASLETDRHVVLRWVSYWACRFQMDLRWGMSVSVDSQMKHVEVSDRSPIKHVSLQWETSVTNGACQSLMGLQSGMSVSNVACRGLWWVLDQACWSPKKHVKVFDGSTIKHVGLRWKILRSSMGLQSGMPVSNVASRGLRWVSNQACRSPMGLW